VAGQLAQNIGLLIFGNVGTGKTYFAACIANALTDKGVPVIMTSFSTIVNSMGGFYDEEKVNYLRSLNNYKLLIIDDLGAERQSDFMLEQVYNIIDSRYKSNLPIIITTNLTLKDIQNPQDMKYKRIYDRITEMCVPLKYDGESRRKEAHADKLAKARQMFAD
jgi:DNA replication protein DnaC